MTAGLKRIVSWLVLAVFVAAGAGFVSLLVVTGVPQTCRAETEPKKGEKAPGRLSRRPLKPGEAKGKPAKPARGAKEGSAASEAPQPEELVVGGGEHYDNSSFDSEPNRLAPIDAVILMDSSGSMKHTDPKRLRDQAAKLFLRFLSEGDKVAIFQFDEDVRPLAPFTEINATNLAALDKAVQDAPAEGHFTDLEAPIETALNLLRSEGRREARKCVILLSDGKMDPRPSVGTAEDLIQRLLDEQLPQYRKEQITLYTLAFSSEADQGLLEDMAKSTDGLFWFAPDVDTIHLRFSDLFLALKKPQVVPLAENGFEIDPNIDEATFYITRKDPAQEIVLITPKGDEISNKQVPLDVKWYRGELFDVITVRRPLPGNWFVRGVEKAEGFATILTDLKLQVRWPETNLTVGDSVLVSVRLSSRGAALQEPGMKDITFYRYKIIDSRDGNTILQGSLTDDGADGDAQADDGIYSATIKMEQVGNFKALIGVTSPTFLRQQQIPFTVSKGMIGLSVEPADVFADKPERFHVVLGQQIDKLKDVAVYLLAKPEGKKEALSVRLVSVPGKEGKEHENDRVFDYPAHKLPAGTYSVKARLSAKDTKKNNEVVQEETLPIVFSSRGPSEGSSESKEGIVTEEEKVVEYKEPAPPGSRDWIVGVICLALAGVWTGGLIFYMLKRFDFSSHLPPREKPYVRSSELEEALSELRSKVSERRRELDSRDLEVFGNLQEDSGAEVEAPPDTTGFEEEAPAAEPPADGAA